MGLGWSKARHSPIAVDFGADSLKLLQVIVGQSRRHVPTEPPQLIAAASAELPENARSDPKARQAFYCSALPELLASQPFKGKRAICAIPAYQTLVQHLQIARVEREDFDAQIGLYLRQRLNVDPSRMVIRRFEVGQVVRDGSPKQEVICMAASRDVVMRHIKLAHKAKLDVVGMHCEPVLILQAFAHLYRREGDGERVTCFVDIGAGTTKVVISHGHEIVFSKIIHVAGDHFTRHVATTNELSFSDVREARGKHDAASGAPEHSAQASQPVATQAGERGEAMSRQPQGMLAVGNDSVGAEGVGPGDPITPPSDGPSDSDTPRPPIQELCTIDGIGEPLDCLVDELQLCSRYYQSIFPGKSIEKLVFLGGEARHQPICQKIARALRIGAQIGDPTARMIKPPKTENTGVDLRLAQPGWAVPVGLCLSEANL